MRIESRYIFGPVPSRRLGYSLGVDIIPMKTCDLNCLYCELGRTSKETLEMKEYAPADQVVAEVEEAIRATERIDYITFSGSGEPTLNSKLGEMIREIKRLTTIPVAVLTNGTLLYLPEVRRALLAADLVVPSLDAVSPDVFRRINRPHGHLRIEKIIEGQKLFRQDYNGQIWLEILLVRGINDTPEEIEKLCEVAEQMNPDRIQLNTVVRPAAESRAQPLSEKELAAIKERFGEKAEIIAHFHPDAVQSLCEDINTAILALAARRPVTFDDICASLGYHPDVATKYIHELIESGKLQERWHGQKRFYFVDREVARAIFKESTTP